MVLVKGIHVLMTERFECVKCESIACPQFSLIWKPPYHLHEVYIYK